MKVNSNRDISFKSIYTNRALKKGLEFAAEKGALFSATTILAMSMVARPISIAIAPNADKENKKVACAKSIASSAAGYFLTRMVSNPVGNAVKKIDSNPKKYMKAKTIDAFKKGYESLSKSKSYALATQLFKLGLSLVVAAPKAILTCLGLPYVLHFLFHKPMVKNGVPVEDKKNIAFRGKGEERLAKGIGKALDTKLIQKFSEKFKNSNFPMHMVAAADALTTATFIHNTIESDHIEEKRKKALVYNAGLSTGLSIISSYILDGLTQKPTEKFIQNFIKANKGMPNLDKQVEGIKIAKPVLLVACVYYMFIPFISTILAEMADHNPKFDIPHKHKVRKHFDKELD